MIGLEIESEAGVPALSAIAELPILSVPVPLVAVFGEIADP